MKGLVKRIEKEFAGLKNKALGFANGFFYGSIGNDVHFFNVNDD